MGERGGVGLVEVAILEALDGLGARAGQAYVKSSRVLASVDQSVGLAPGYGYEILTDLVLPWRMPVLLADGHGNFGGRGNDPPANARYTEVRLSRAGEVVLAAERGQLAPVPVGLINGNSYGQGSRPPFRPQGVIDALRRVIGEPSVSGEELVGIVGPPDFLTGSVVTGDLAELRAGNPAELQLAARVTVTDEATVAAQTPDAGPWFRPERNRTLLVIDNLPPMVNTDEVVQSIAGRARPADWSRRHPELHQATRLQVREVHDESGRGRTWFACVPEPDADPEQVRAQLLDVYGVSVTLQVHLPQPLASMMRRWATAHQGEDILASLTALEQAIAAADRHQDW